MKLFVGLAIVCGAAGALADDPPKQQLMPTCAGCAAEARPMMNGEVATQWNLNLRYIPGVEKDARARATLDYRVTPRLTVGLEYGSKPEVLPRATWFVSPQTEHLPSVVLGITADRLSTPKGEAVFLTFSKTIPGSQVTPFVSAKYSTDTKDVLVPFGANFVFENFTLQALYDGNYTHAIVTKNVGNINFNLILARMKHLGVGVSVGF